MKTKQTNMTGEISEQSNQNCLFLKRSEAISTTNLKIEKFGILYAHLSRNYWRKSKVFKEKREGTTM